MSAVHPEPADPVDEELDALLQRPEVRERLDDFERRRAEGKLGEGNSNDEARRIVGLPPHSDSAGR
ncbi:MAG: hypothetical protein JF887_09270 [Candidatus Dormibacteraeota bacterium]|uniref:Uncharacterized protein n=1 Tax=Candidatus Amunia macphersoniae TaxID=3127014 RepID=A0A934KPP8_9BACT|nr:hypothetical protein [Candidatus Dormibacteraeota bacterium]